MAVYDINGNVISKDGGVEFNNTQVDSIYGLMYKTAFLSNIENEKRDFDLAFNLARESLHPLESIDSDFRTISTDFNFHARINRGYHVSLIFNQYNDATTNYVVSFARMHTYKNQFDYVPSMYTFPASEQIEIGVSNIVMDGIETFAIRNRLADSNQNGNVRTGSITSIQDFSNILTLATAEPTGSFYVSADIGKANAKLEFDFNLKVGDELWV